jgi:hypothetical protein
MHASHTRRTARKLANQSRADKRFDAVLEGNVGVAQCTGRAAPRKGDLVRRLDRAIRLKNIQTGLKLKQRRPLEARMSTFLPL